MLTYDWSKFELRIPIKALPQEIYRCLATPAGIESWFLRSAKYMTPDDRLRASDEFIERGDRYTWLWHGYDDDTIEHNDILEANGVDTLRFVFAGHCIVTITIGMLDTDTIVQLAQENIPTGEEGRSELHVGCMQGWTFYLSNLKSILEGGIDLRNRNVRIGRVVNS